MPEDPPTLAARVRALDPAASWSAVKGRIAAGAVAVDGVVVRDPAHRPAVGCRVDVGPGPAAAGRRPADRAIDRVRIVWADGDLAVVDKPAGLLTVPFEAGDRDTLLALARVVLGRREGGARGTPPPLRAVQRLDKETSGLVVFARNVVAERALQAQLLARSMHRRYLALALGRVDAETFSSDLVEDRGDGLRGSFRPTAAARRPPPDAKRAITHVEPIETFAGATLVACRLETGRTHQIRIHLAEAGHPLLGERVYGRRATTAAGAIGAPAAGRPMLHAAELGFDHPRTGAPMRFASEPPDDFAALLERLRSGG